MKTRCTFLILMIIASTYHKALAQTKKLTIDQSAVSVELKQKTAIWGLVNDGVDVQIKLGDKGTYSTYLGSFRTEADARRTIVAFVNRQKLLSKKYGVKIKIDEESARRMKPLNSEATPYDEIVALFSIDENLNYSEDDLNSCLKQVSTTGSLSDLSESLGQYYYKNQILPINPKDIQLRFIQEKSFLCEGCAGVTLEVLIDNQIIYSVFFGGSHKTKDDVQKSIELTLNKLKQADHPILLTFTRALKVV